MYWFSNLLIILFGLFIDEVGRIIQLFTGLRNVCTGVQVEVKVVNKCEMETAGGIFVSVCLRQMQIENCSWDEESFYRWMTWALDASIGMGSV